MYCPGVYFLLGCDSFFMEILQQFLARRSGILFNMLDVRSSGQTSKGSEIFLWARSGIQTSGSSSLLISSRAFPQPLTEPQAPDPSLPAHQPQAARVLQWGSRLGPAASVLIARQGEGRAQIACVIPAGNRSWRKEVFCPVHKNHPRASQF